MNRPAPRKSSLTGSSPVAPPAAAEPVAAAPIEEAAPETRAAVRPVTKKAGTKYPPKVTFYQDPEDTARTRGALLHTQISEGSRSLSAFINQAVMAEVERLEAKYNGGKPFPAVGSREMPQGRPMGE
ncbi:MAG: hypothetical protein BGN98_03905 [Microbacterium sp. 69-7]|uniref:ParB family protein n=1 Tax=Microbacterium sp. 69-7 TaxID=1895784 RepID=UPI00095BC2DE|nr:hypothetical protein [Microbacterium sp. 69-7]OJU47388.1 MAG: hypothetical protein BGN98_03905 [Microbacterium sp. 69-7]